MLTRCPLLFLVAAVSFGCAETPSENDLQSASPYSEEAEQDAELSGLTVLAEQRVRVTYGRLPEGYNEIEDKRAALPADVRRDYYDHYVGNITKTPDGVPFQFFGGAVGFGAIYRVNGTQAVYGPWLEGWARQGYERGWLGYPTRDVDTFTRKQTFFSEHVAADIANGGLQTVRRQLQWDGRAPAAAYTEAREYLVSVRPQEPASTPQDCKLKDRSYPLNTVEAQLWPTFFSVLWCGPDPEDDPDSYLDVDPQHI